MDDIFMGVMKTLNKGWNLSCTAPPIVTDCGSGKDYLQNPANRTCATLHDWILHYKTLTAVPSKLLKELDLLLTDAKLLRSMFNKGPKFKSLSMEIRRITKRTRRTPPACRKF